MSASLRMVLAVVWLAVQRLAIGCPETVHVKEPDEAALLGPCRARILRADAETMTE